MTRIVVFNVLYSHGSTADAWVVTNGGYKLEFCIEGNNPLSLVITGKLALLFCPCLCVHACG